MKTLSTALLLLSALSGNVLANEPLNIYKCSYTQLASDFDGLKELDKPLEITFATKVGGDNAAIIGNLGRGHAKVYKGDEAITFMEPLDYGIIQLTVIAESMKSVHSRHTILGDKLMPSQYYGTCVKK